MLCKTLQDVHKDRTSLVGIAPAFALASRVSACWCSVVLWLVVPWLQFNIQPVTLHAVYRKLAQCHKLHMNLSP